MWHFQFFEYGIENELANTVVQRVLRWFGHVDRIDEYRTARGVLIVDVSVTGRQADGHSPKDSWPNRH